MRDTLTVTEAARRLGVKVKTVQRWEREGRLIPVSRTATNRRVYTLEQIAIFQGVRLSGAEEARKNIAYCRVSSAAQKPDLKNQRRILEEFCTTRGLAAVEYVEEVGGGLNFNRKKFLSLMDDIGMRQIKILVLAHRDRLMRFGFEWFEHYAKINWHLLSPMSGLVR